MKESVLEASPSTAEGEALELVLADSLMAPASLQEFAVGGQLLFDVYQKVDPTGYERRWTKGQAITPETVIISKGPFFFRTSDRPKFITQALDRLGDVLLSKASGERKFAFIKFLAEKYDEEMVGRGLSTGVIEDGILLSQGIVNFLKFEKDLPRLIRLLNLSDSPGAKNFYVAVFSVLISRHLEWAGDRTSEIVAQGSLFHSTGLLGHPELRRTSLARVGSDQQILFRAYPGAGEEMLRGYHQITQAVRQIVYQHRECTNRSGFPNELSGVVIYPLAKVVGLALGFVEHAGDQKETCGRAVVSFLQNPVELAKYESLFARALALSFSKGGSKC